MNIIKRIKLFFLYHNRKYKNVLELTANNKLNINEYDNDSLIFQSYASFFTKNYHHSQKCLIELYDRETIKYKECNLLAYLHARRNEKEKAITKWCKSLELKKNNITAKNALEYIREKGRSINLIDDEYFDKFSPIEPFLIPYKLSFKILLILLIIIFISISIFFTYNYLTRNNRKITKDITNVYLEDFNKNILEVPKNNSEKYSYTEKEIKIKFEKIKMYILDNKPVDAQIEINKIKISNASLNVKFKMDTLESFIDEPDYAVFKNKITYEDFINEKNIYNNVYIFWFGRIVNKKITKNTIEFDFIIGEEEKGIIKGIIPVIFKKEIIVNNNEIAGVFGRIKIEDNKTFLEGLYLRKK